MRTVILTLLIAIILATAGAFGFVYAGIYNISATDPHWPITRWAMETVRTQSIKAHARGITAPAWITDNERAVAGTEHFAAHCASCHGAPGVPAGDIANGLYPKPPDLTEAAKEYTPGELFWILKNGIKMTGMPSWSDHSDDELWGTVAFLEKLPSMSEDDYRKLVMESMMHGGGRHSHGGDGMTMDHQSMHGMAMPGMTMPSPAAPGKPDTRQDNAHQH